MKKVNILSHICISPYINLLYIVFIITHSHPANLFDAESDNEQIGVVYELGGTEADVEDGIRDSSVGARENSF